MRIYVASSWRNLYQQKIVEILRNQGHSVYDFRNPRLGEHGFAWSQIDSEWETWNPESFRKFLLDPIAASGFARDMNAIRYCACCVLVLPCGRSAHLESGFAVGIGKKLLIYMPEPCEPELMYLWAEKICVSEYELMSSVRHAETR